MRLRIWNPLRFFSALDIHGVLALSGVVGPFVWIAADFAAAMSEPKYSYLRDSISSLALTSTGWIQTIGFLAIGLLIEIFAAGLFLNVRKKVGFDMSVAILAFFGFGLLLIGAFRTDAVGAARTVEGTIHGAASNAVFWLFPLAVLLLLPSLKADPRWKQVFRYTVISTSLALVLVLVRPFLPAKISWFGLYERVLVGNAAIWVEVVAMQLLILSVRRQREARQAEGTSAQPE